MIGNHTFPVWWTLTAIDGAQDREPGEMLCYLAGGQFEYLVVYEEFRLFHGDFLTTSYYTNLNNSS